VCAGRVTTKRGGYPARAEAGDWLFKETSTVRARHGTVRPRKGDLAVDRWHNSGGLRGSRDMPADSPRIRRRCGGGPAAVSLQK
jgi:hypothetical protein